MIFFFSCIINTSKKNLHQTTGADNYKEKLLMAYLAGRGNGNVHIITQGDSVIAADHGKNRVANVIGPYASYTERERALEVNDVLTHFTSSTGGTEHEYFDESDVNFKKNVVFKDPDVSRVLDMNLKCLILIPLFSLKSQVTEEHLYGYSQHQT